MDPAGRARLYHLLQTAAHRLKIRADRDSQAVAGLTAAQAAAMFVIQLEAGGTTQRRVAAQLKLQESAVTTMVGRLMEAGFVHRAPSQTDGRAWTVTLTDAGEAALAAFRIHLDAMNAQLSAALGGEDEVARFAAGLKAIIELPDPE